MTHTRRRGYTLILRKAFPIGAKKAYTLIEMLITVAIFAGLLIIVLGSFATSSSSTAKVAGLREKSGAVRVLVDSIATDFRFLYRDRVFKDNEFGPPAGRSCQMDNGACVFTGYLVDTDRIVMALLYPGDDNQTELVRKEYRINNIKGRNSVWIEERRGCGLNGSHNWTCDREQTVDLLPESYELNRGTTLNSGFGGLTVFEAANVPPVGVTPFVNLNFVIKPVGDICSNSASTCYEVRTTLNVGK